jgi:hypothetical protein
MRHFVKINPSVLINIICSAHIFLFIYAAASKLGDLEKFSIQIGKSPILSGFSDIIIILIPGIETLLAILLISERVRLLALFGSFSLMSLFSIYIVYILFFSPYVPCSCGGVLEKMSWAQHLVFNCCFILISTVAILIHPTKSNKELIA